MISTVKQAARETATRLKVFAVITLAALVLSFAGNIEGRVAPVVSDFQITRMETAGEGFTRFWGTAVRVRDCKWRGMNWYLGDGNSDASATVRIEESTKIRRLGKFSFGPWVAAVTPDELRDKTFAVAIHECHPLWSTRTRIYP